MVDEHDDVHSSTDCNHHLQRARHEVPCSSPAVLRGHGCTWPVFQRLARRTDVPRDGDRLRSIEALDGRGS